MSQNSDTSNDSGPSNPDKGSQPLSDVQQSSRDTLQQPSVPYNSGQSGVQQPSWGPSQPFPGPYNFGWPGVQQPSWGTSQPFPGLYNFAQPADRKKPFLLVFAIGALALIVVLALLIGTVVAIRNISNNSNGAATQLSIAATNLSSALGTHYVGTITDPNGDKIQIDLEVANNGSTHGTLTQRGDILEVLVVDHKTFLKASELFWSKHGAPQNSAGEYAKQWVKVSGDVIGIDIQKVLAPVTLGKQLSQTARSHQATLGSEATINGVKTRKVITPQGTLYITTTAPQRIVRIEGNPALTPSNSPKTTTKLLFALSQSRAENPGAGAYQFDLSNLSDTQAEKLYDLLQQVIPDLQNSINSNVQFKLNGNGVLDPCDSTGCTATLTISNTVTSTNPDLNVDQPITVSITINFTVDSIPVGGCLSISRTMLPNGETTVWCSVTYSIPPSSTRTMDEVAATWTAFAQALVSTDIPRILNDLKKELEKSRSDVSKQIDKVLSQLATDNDKQAAIKSLQELVGEKVPDISITDPKRKEIYEQLIGNEKFRDVDENDKNFIARLVDANPQKNGLTKEQIEAFLAHAKSEGDLDRIILLYAYVYKDGPPGLTKLLRDIASDSSATLNTLGTPTTQPKFTSYKGSLFQLEWIATQKSTVEEIEPPDSLGNKGFDVLLNDGTYVELRARQQADTLMELEGKLDKKLPEELPALKKLRFVFKTGAGGLDNKGIATIQGRTPELVEYGREKGVEIEVVFWPPIAK